MSSTAGYRQRKTMIRALHMWSQAVLLMCAISSVN